MNRSQRRRGAADITVESEDKTQTDLLFEGVGSRVEFDLLNGDKRSSKAT